ncbi:hypothetical protein ACROYT_G001268 [Oculina patagonica]
MVGEGGALGWDGAMRLQVSRRARMARVMPGQNTVLSARAVMEVEVDSHFNKTDLYQHEARLLQCFQCSIPHPDVWLNMKHPRPLLVCWWEGSALAVSLVVVRARADGTVWLSLTKEGHHLKFKDRPLNLVATQQMNIEGRL